MLNKKMHVSLLTVFLVQHCISDAVNPEHLNIFLKLPLSDFHFFDKECSFTRELDTVVHA